MAKIRVIKKNDDYSMDYQVGDILEVTGTWYGGINVNSKTGIPLCLDKDEYEEIPENTDLSHEEYERAANYWKEKDAQSKKLDQDVLKKASGGVYSGKQHLRTGNHGRRFCALYAAGVYVS